MHKDIIYIDTDDDITSIIGKIKASHNKVIALVPPKRAGVLQSAVNMRLLSRTADKSNKHLVIITNDKTLMALSASSQIPIAKNLQSQPEVIEIPALEIDDGEDIIEGAQLPVGELMKTIKTTDSEEKIVKVMHDINIDGDQVDEGQVDNNKSSNMVSKNKIKVPDFSSFRKKLFLGVGGGVLAIIFLVWAMVFAPAATIIISAKTQPAPVSLALKLGGTQATDISKNVIQSLTKTLEKNVSIDFTATGTAEIGEKAKGTITLSNADSSDPINVPAGTLFSKDDLDFVTTATVDVPGATVEGGDVVAGAINVGIIASKVGSAYNLTAGAYLSSISGITASSSATSGGESHQAIVVTAEDINKAKTALMALKNTSVKSQLADQFVNSEAAIDSSFTAEYGEYVSSPLTGKETTDGKATLTSKTKFKLTAIAKSELETFLKDAINKQIDNDQTQKIYDDGFSEVKLTNYFKNDNGETINVSTTGEIGPNINQSEIKQSVKGKGYGDVQSLLEGKDGINSVDIKFSYFWVSTVPGDVNKIEVQFVLEND